MKKVILFLIFGIFSHLHSQCEYSVITYDNSSGKGILKTKPITLDYFETPYNGRIILTYLTRIGDQYFIELEITKDSYSQDLEPICFKKGDRLSFSLKNNTVVSVAQVEDKICGVKTYDRRSNFTSVSNYAKFILTQEAYDKLIKSEVVLMKVSSSEFQKNYVIKDELETIKGDEIIYTNPGKFFIEHVPCLTNPNFK